jgi:hypothetical protein
MHACYDDSGRQRLVAVCSRSVIEQLCQGTSNFCDFGHSSRAANAAGKDGWDGLGQYRYWRLPQTRLTLVWQDEAREIYVGGRRHQGGLQAGEVSGTESLEWQRKKFMVFFREKRREEK